MKSADWKWVALLAGLLSGAVLLTRPWELIAGLLSTGSFESLRWAFREACDDLIVVAVRGAILFWGVFMGRLLGTGFFTQPIRLKVAFISMPVVVLVAAFLASYSFKWVVDPGETTAHAIHDAEVTFFCVLLPLWIGCVWGMVYPVPNRSDSYEDRNLIE
jgi:hypothetical protein